MPNICFDELEYIRSLLIEASKTYTDLDLDHGLNKFLAELGMSVPLEEVSVEEFKTYYIYKNYKARYPNNWHNTNILKLFLDGKCIPKHPPIEYAYRYALVLIIYLDSKKSLNT